jgi:iron-sulfur cluster assembly accessory protein
MLRRLITRVPTTVSTTSTTHQRLWYCPTQRTTTTTYQSQRYYTTTTTTPSIENTEPTTKPIVKKRRIVPLREPFKLTEAASQRVSELIRQQPGAIGLKVGMTRRGCNGLTTTLDYVYENNVPKFWEEVTDKHVKVYVDPSCLMYVIGTTMDYVDDEVRSEFVFDNPNAKSQCGCGDSISVPEKIAKQNQMAIEKFKQLGEEKTTTTRSSGEETNSSFVTTPTTAAATTSNSSLI